jgi:hypothetical protein
MSKVTSFAEALYAGKLRIRGCTYSWPEKQSKVIIVAVKECVAARC